MPVRACMRVYRLYDVSGTLPEMQRLLLEMQRLLREMKRARPTKQRVRQRLPHGATALRPETDGLSRFLPLFRINDEPCMGTARGLLLYSTTTPPRGALIRSKMYMKMWISMGALAVAASLVGGCAELSDEERAELGVDEDVELNTTSEALLSDNGLKSLNGLTSVNGLKSLNGLSTTNGLKSLNGLTTINGLATRNGLKSLNGLPVNCDGSKVPGTTCTGEPDGLLKLSGGLMSTDDGKMLASYLVKCALNSSQEVRVKDYAGNLVSMKGSIGLAPKWLGDSGDPDGLCGTPCEEKVSACLMAHSNRSGAHVPILLSGPQPVLGSSYDPSSFPYLEGVYYGNIFVDPPRFFVADGYSPTSPLALQRSCEVGGQVSSSTTRVNCMFRFPGWAISKCTAVSGTVSNNGWFMTANTCVADADGISSTTDLKTWTNPITVWVQTQPGRSTTGAKYDLVYYKDNGAGPYNLSISR